MALKRIYDSQDEIPQGMEDYYTEQDGKWVLDAEAGEGERNAEDVRRALRARDNEKAEREKLRKELDDLKAKFEGIDLEKIDDIKNVQQRLEEAEHEKLISEKKFEEAAEKKYQRQLAEMQRTIQKIEQQHQADVERYNTLRSKHLQAQIPAQLAQYFQSEGADPKKLAFLLSVAEKSWELDENDEPTPIDWVDGGRTKITAVGADGKTLTMKEQVKSILADNPWAVLESTGSRASHQGNIVNGQFVMSESEAKDLRRYEAVKAQAVKAGAEIQIVPG